MPRSRVLFLCLILAAIVLALVMESGLWSPFAVSGRVGLPPAQKVAISPARQPAPAPSFKPAPQSPACTTPGAGWHLMWSDDFNGPFDPYRWHVVTGQPRKNGEVEDYLKSNDFTENGDLVLRTARQGSGYSSGAIDTQGTMSLLYGKVVIRAKLPRGQGIWPAFWLRPADGSLLPETDIMEVLGSRPRVVDMTLHWQSAQGPTHTYVEHTGPDLSAAFHTYTLVWLPGELRWYLDGQLMLDVKAHVPASPMYLTLNTAVGSSWGGYPTATSQLPQDLLVDYVHVYEYGQCTSGRFAAMPGAALQSGGDGRVAVFVLHQISNSNPGPYNITPARLAADVTFLLRHHVRFMSLRQFLAYEEGRWKPHGAWVLLTFDDGYSSIYRNAAPILKAHHIPAALFLIGSRVGSERFWMSAPQVEALARSGYWSIEAHTYAEHSMQNGHPTLQTLGRRRNRRQIESDVHREQSLVGSLSGKFPYAFAFPYGYQTNWLAGIFHRTYALTFGTEYALARPGQSVVPRIDLGTPEARVQELWQRLLSH